MSFEQLASESSVTFQNSTFIEEGNQKHSTPTPPTTRHKKRIHRMVWNSSVCNFCVFSFTFLVWFVHI